MIVRRVHSAAAFADIIQPLVVRDPVGHSILAVSLGRVLRGEAKDPDVVWWAAEDDTGKAVAAGQHLNPYPLGLHGVPDEVGDAVADPLVDLFQRLHREPTGASGPRRAVMAFARGWRDRTGRDCETVRELGRWVLDTLLPPVGVPGTPRAPYADEVNLVQRWVTEFHHEVGSSAEAPPDWATLRLAAGTLVLWEVEGEPVALAGYSAAEAGVSRVGPVWTPVERRGRGYGSTVTSAATQAALDAGARMVSLYTDLANPVSNAIYARLGYRRVGEEVEVKLMRPAVTY